MRLRRHHLVALALASGCAAQEAHFLEAPADARSALLVFWSSGEVWLHGLSLDEPEPYELGDALQADGERATVLFYPWPAADLGLGPGPVELAKPEVEGRPIPDPTLGIHQSRVEGTVLGAFSKLDALPPEEQELRLPPIDQAACIEAGGCLRAATDRARCERPCPEPSPATPPASPLRPERPEFREPATGQCPAGFVPRPHDQLVFCEPLALAETRSCGPSEGLYVDQSGCTPIGRDCPSETLFVPNTGARIFVTPSGDDAATGAEAAPLRSLSRAIELAAPGDVIHLSRGDFLGDLSITRDLQIIGACASGSRIFGRVTVARGTSLIARELSVDSSTNAIELRPGAGLDAAALILETSGARVLSVEPAASARVSQSVLRGGTLAAAYVDRGTLQLQEVSVLGAAEDGVWVGGTAGRLEANGLVVIGGGTNPSLVDQDKKAGIAIYDGAYAEIERALVQRRAGTGIFVARGSEAQVSDAHFRDLRDGAVVVTRGSRARLHRVHSEAVACAGFVAEDSARIEGGDLAAVNTLPCGTEESGQGLVVHVGSEGALSRVWLERSRVQAVFLENSALVLDDLTVLDTEETTPDFPNGSGLAVFGSDFTLRRAEIRRASNAGIGILPIMLDTPATIILEDVWVADILPSRHPEFANRSGAGIFSNGASSIELRRVLVERVAATGLTITGADFPPAQRAKVEDLTVRETHHGIALTQNLATSLARIEISDAAGFGLVMNRGAQAEVSDLMVRGTTHVGSGVWLELQTGAAASSAITTLAARRFVLRGLATGVRAEVDSELHLSDGRFADDRLALDLAPGCEARAALDGVVFEDVAEPLTGELCAP